MSDITSDTIDSKWRPKVIIFDLLTGLIDSWTLWDASTPTGRPMDARPWREHYLKLTFAKGAYVPYEDMVRLAAREAGFPDSAPEALLQNWDKLQPWPEVAQVLQALKQRGYKLGVVTNCSTRMGRIAARCAAKGTGGGRADDMDIFDAVVTAEESGFYKPVPQAYEAILDVMGVKASDALFVAGSAGDVQGATDVGMKVVWHNKVGLARKGSAVPIKEARNLDEALSDFI